MKKTATKTEVKSNDDALLIGHFQNFKSFAECMPPEYVVNYDTFRKVRALDDLTCSVEIDDHRVIELKTIVGLTLLITSSKSRYSGKQAIEYQLIENGKVIDEVKVEHNFISSLETSNEQQTNK